MKSFQDYKIKKQLLNALKEQGIEQPTPIQDEAYSTILSGRDFVGIAQTGTGKTLAYLLPILQNLKYSEQKAPRVLILVPTRELVIQTVKEIKKLTTYINVRVLGVYGGTNINTQKTAVNEGLDIIVGTPQRLYDLALTKVLKLNSIKKLVVDEVDIMLDFGYKTQLRNLFEYLPGKRQNLLFSATMTSYVDQLINRFLINPVKITIAVSGTRLNNINQKAFHVPNFYTKANLLLHILKNKTKYKKVLIFVGSQIKADRLEYLLAEKYFKEVDVIHANKSQNQRTVSIENFTEGNTRILIATDVISRGVDIDKIDTVISFDVPNYPENYMHRIGRTGRAENKGNSILLYTEKEISLKGSIEALMNYKIPEAEVPEEVEYSLKLTPEEEDKQVIQPELNTKISEKKGASHHEKSAKNSKVKAVKKSYKKQLKERYKKPIRKGDKTQNLKKKNLKKKRK